MPTSLAVPTISPTFGQTMPQSEVEKWIQQLQDRIDNAYPNDSGRREELMRYFYCILDNDPSFRFSSGFVLDFVRGEVVVDECVQVTAEPPGQDPSSSAVPQTALLIVTYLYSVIGLLGVQ
jgi:hypothetical protein